MARSFSNSNQKGKKKERKALLGDKIEWFGTSKVTLFQRENGPSFEFTITVTALGISYPHGPWGSQSSGSVQRANYSLQKILPKFYQVTEETWLKLSPQDENGT